MWIGQQTPYTDLLPLQEPTIGEMPGTVHGLAIEALLELGEVVDRHHPAHPTAAHLGTGAHGLAKGCLFCGRMLQNFYDLDVALVGQRQDPVRRAEPRMEATIEELLPKQVTEPFGLGFESVGTDGKSQMIDMHAPNGAGRRAEREIERLSSRDHHRPSLVLPPTMDTVTRFDGEGLRVVLSSSSVYPESTAAAFALASRLGYHGVEIMVGTDSISADPDALAELASYHQMPVTAIHAPTLLLTQRVWGTDPWAKLEKAGEVAATLGAPVVVVHPPFRWQRNYASVFTDGIRRLEANTGLIYAVENMYPWRGPGGGEVRAYAPSWDSSLLDCDHLTLDLSHAAIARQHSVELVRDWGERLAHVHLTDGTDGPTDQHLLPGEGDQDPGAVIDELVRSGYPGQVVVEVSTRGMTRQERIAALQRTVDFVQAQWKLTERPSS